MSQINPQNDWYSLALTHYDYVFNVARKRTLNDSVAEDITQEVYLKLLNLDESRRCQPYAMKSWLFRVTQNTISHNRNKEVRTLTCDPSLMPNNLENGEFFDYAVSADYDYREVDENDLSKSELMNLVSRSIDKLKNPRHRRVIDLFYIQGLSGKEVSKILKVPEGTVRSRLYWASRSLKQIVLSDRSVLQDKLLSL